MQHLVWHNKCLNKYVKLYVAKSNVLHIVLHHDSTPKLSVINRKVVKREHCKMENSKQEEEYQPEYTQRHWNSAGSLRKIITPILSSSKFSIWWLSNLKSGMSIKRVLPMFRILFLHFFLFYRKMT